MSKNLSFFFFAIILISLVYSVNYLNSDGVFDTYKHKVYDKSGNYDYVISFIFENYVGKKLDYDVEVIYTAENTVVGSGTFSCLDSVCKNSIDISKTFFGSYEVIVTSRYKGKYYQDRFTFDIDLINSDYEVDMKKQYKIVNGSLNISGSIISDKNQDINYLFEFYPKSSPDTRVRENIICFNVCEFDFLISSSVVIDEYIVNIYSPIGDTQKKFRAVYVPEKKKFADFVVENGGENLSSFFLYNSNNTDVKANVDIIDGNEKVNPSSANSQKNYDLDFRFNNTTVKSIYIPQANLDNVTVGFEKVPSEKVNLLNTISDSFAIDPKFDTQSDEYYLTFVATGAALLKCVEYDFMTQNCYGSFEKILDTIPGKTYTIKLNNVDPLFVQVNDYILSPTGASCQDSGNGWAGENCDDTSYTGDKSCPAGTGGEYTYCDDNFIETHTAKKIGDGGVRMFFEDISQSKCENINNVEVIYKTWWSDITGTQSLSIDADGDGWTPVTFTTDLSEPASNRIVDVTNSLPVGETWDCTDFFQIGATAGLETFWTGIGGKPGLIYTMDVDTLVYRVSYNYSLTPLDTDKDIYSQSETASITGSSIWDDGSNVSINITRSDGMVETLPQQIPVNNSFNTFYDIGDYYPIGEYEVFAIQDNDTTKNYFSYFNVTKRSPSISASRMLRSINEKVSFSGSNWAGNSQVNVEIISPSGKSYDSYTLNTSPIGDLNFNYTFPNDLYIENGWFEFRFAETYDSSYNTSSLVDFIFRPSSSSIAFSQINESDNIYYNLGLQNGIQTMDINFSEMIPKSMWAENLTVYLEYYTIGTANRYIEWFNSTSLQYELICTIPTSDIETVLPCDLTDYVNYDDSYNNLNIRLYEDGKKNEEMHIDSVFVKRNYTKKPFVHDLKIIKNITRTSDNNFSVKISLNNLGNLTFEKNRYIDVYSFLPVKYDLNSPFLFSASQWYNSTYVNYSLSNQGYNGTIYKFTISPTILKSSVFDEYFGQHHENNSWYVLFNITGNLDYNYENLFEIGLDSYLK